MKKFAAIWAVCGAASIGLAWTALTSTSAGTLDATAAQSGSQCLGAFSKDSCEGVLTPTAYEQTFCPVLNCATAVAKEAVYTATLFSSGQDCGLVCPGECDEFPDGELTVNLSFAMRLNSCCPSRGYWVGAWEYATVDGRLFRGEAHGTVGVGTNRPFACPVVDDFCEECADFQQVGLDEVYGFEGSFRGFEVVSPGVRPDELHFTMDGSWIVPPFFPEPFNGSMPVVNRFDGVSVTYCP